MPANWGPPPGYMQALMQRNENNNAALAQIGRFTGAVGAGIGGALQAGRNPEPGVSRFDAGLMNFNAGMAGSGQRMSGSMTRAMGAGGGDGPMNYKQYSEQAKALRSLVDAFAPKDAEGKLTPEGEAIKAKATISSLGELQSMVEGHVLQRKQKMEDAQLAADQQRQQLLAAQLGQMKQQQGYEAALGEATQRAVGMTYRDAIAQGQGPIRPQPVTQAGLLQSILATPGAAQSHTGGRLIERVLGDNAPRDIVPKKIDLGGTPVIYGAGGQFQIDPAYALNQKLAADKQLADFKTQLKSAGFPDGSEVVSEGGAMYVVGPDGRMLTPPKAVNEFQQTMASLVRGGAPAAGRTTNPAPAPAMPRSKDQLRAGQQYQTPRGVATWDGEKFVQ